MATLTIRNVPASVVKALKTLALRNQRSMEQEVRVMLEERTTGRAAAMRRIEASRGELLRPVTPEEIDAWVEVGRR
ncbi:MAG: hypothetical protein HYX65_03490 [Gemmatimonadetes bacterium]|nr:hypothetical protein [Gemmatimonadota bacterium]